jgi:hypothetical protein
MVTELNPSRSRETVQARARYTGHGVLNVFMPEIVLEGAGVLAVIGQFETAGMAEHSGCTPKGITN